MPQRAAQAWEEVAVVAMQAQKLQAVVRTMRVHPSMLLDQGLHSVGVLPNAARTTTMHARDTPNGLKPKIKIVRRKNTTVLLTNGGSAVQTVVADHWEKVDSGI